LPGNELEAAVAAWRRTLTLLAGLVLTLTIAVPVAAAAPAGPPSSLSQCSAELFHGDRRLGPEQLPVLGPVGRELHGYSRTGHRSVETFLDTFWDPTASSFRFPPQDGYVLRPDGSPIRSVQDLVPGQRIDRFGSEFGSFLAPEGSPYSSRSIPPQNLVGSPAASCNYKDYKVLRDFAVFSGPVAPWFFQAGLGQQFQLNSGLVPGAPTPLNVMWLVDNGYLQRLPV
jgi:hypothetical protein